MYACITHIPNAYMVYRAQCMPSDIVRTQFAWSRVIWAPSILLIFGQNNILNRLQNAAPSIVFSSSFLFLSFLPLTPFVRSPSKHNMDSSGKIIVIIIVFLCKLAHRSQHSIKFDGITFLLIWPIYAYTNIYIYMTKERMGPGGLISLVIPLL